MSKATQMIKKILNYMEKNNAPVVAVIADMETKKSATIIGEGDKMNDVNASLLLDGMINNKALMDAVFSACLYLIVEYPQFKDLFMEKLDNMEASVKQGIVTSNIAEA